MYQLNDFSGIILHQDLKFIVQDINHNIKTKAATIPLLALVVSALDHCKQCCKTMRNTALQRYWSYASMFWSTLICQVLNLLGFNFDSPKTVIHVWLFYLWSISHFFSQGMHCISHYMLILQFKITLDVKRLVNQVQLLKYEDLVLFFVTYHN